MKVFCFIFSIYILFLSLQPCEELKANVELRVNKTTRQTQMRAAEKASQESDDCSPFCICSCCHFSTAYQFRTFTVTGKLTTTEILSPKYSYQNPYSKAYKNSIWQPPKI